MAKFQMNTKALLDGGMAGAITPYATKFAGDLGPPLAMAAIGAWRHNETLQTLAGFSIGSRLAASNLLGASGTTSGGYL